MEGGTSNGTIQLAERWMFDPTANEQQGSWTLMGDMPPRTLGTVAAVSYTTAVGSKTVKRAIAFGGEVGMLDPTQGVSGASFVPPTLGDTLIFDFETNLWHRADLLGKGASGSIEGEGFSELDRRQSYLVASPTLTESLGMPKNDQSILSPPPLAGAMMVVRTRGPSVAGDTSSTLKTLTIPEVYLFGGRTKEGKYHDLRGIYKFCMGSTGETRAWETTALVRDAGQNDATCDAYDATYNPTSPSPKDSHSGRWIKKDTSGTNGTAFYSFQGAAAYDVDRDRIMLFGGRSPGGASTSVTSSTQFSLDTGLYEYQAAYRSYTDTGATPAETDEVINGSWREAPLCDATVPAGRYGHAMHYDASRKQLIVVGGNDANGTPLTQTKDSSTTPEVWAATYDSTADCYTWKQKTLFGNLAPSSSTTTMPSDGFAYAASVMVPGAGFNTGFYSLLDHVCANQGPVYSQDASISKLLAGGVYIDIDRTGFGPNENLLMNLTFLPFGTTTRTADGRLGDEREKAIIKIHLIKSGQSTDTIRASLQPRHLAFSQLTLYPQVAESIAIVSPPDGEMHQEQVLLPVSIDPSIDRIRIERYSGSAILIDATLYRMGYR